MAVSMYIPLVSALILASVPFAITRSSGVFPLKRKCSGHHLIELAAGFIPTAVLVYILESCTDAVRRQDWELYAIVVRLYLIFASPCFVWRYLWHARNRK